MWSMQTLDPTYLSSPIGSPVLGLVQQRNAYLTRLGGSAADTNALYIV